MKKMTKKTPKKPAASHQLPVRFDEESYAALQRLVGRLKDATQSDVVRWAVKYFDKEVLFDVDRHGEPMDPPQDTAIPISGSARPAASGSR